MECLKGFVAAGQSGTPLSRRTFGSFSDDLNVGFCQISAMKSMDEFPQKECSFIDVTSSYNWDSLFVTKITCHGIFKHRGFSNGFLQNFHMLLFNKTLSSPWGPETSNLRCRKRGKTSRTTCCISIHQRWNNLRWGNRKDVNVVSSHGNPMTWIPWVRNGILILLITQIKNQLLDVSKKLP